MKRIKKLPPLTPCGCLCHQAGVVLAHSQPCCSAPVKTAKK